MGVGTSMAWDVGTGTSMGIGHVCGYKVGAQDTGVGHGDGNGAWALGTSMGHSMGTGSASPGPPTACRLLQGLRRGWGLCQLPGFPKEPTLTGAGHQETRE